MALEELGPETGLWRAVNVTLLGRPVGAQPLLWSFSQCYRLPLWLDPSGAACSTVQWPLTDHVPHPEPSWPSHRGSLALNILIVYSWEPLPMLGKWHPSLQNARLRSTGDAWLILYNLWLSACFMDQLPTRSPTFMYCKRVKMKNHSRYLFYFLTAYSNGWRCLYCLILSAT